ncbi:MAG: type II toxin-antitoxin system VapC family toxin [Alkalispirochaeta sp.]
MLDTNILIYLMKHKSQSIVERIAAIGDEGEAVMSFVTYAELVKGAAGSDRTEKVLSVLSELTRKIPVDYAIGEELCRHYGHYAMRLQTAGTPIGGNDLWIACHALARGAVLVTNNTSEFSRIEGLQLENWV